MASTKTSRKHQALAPTLKSLELKPKNPDALRNLGAIYSSLRLYNDALIHPESIEIQPYNHNYINLSEIYKSSMIPKAIESINHAIKLDAQDAMPTYIVDALA